MSQIYCEFYWFCSKADEDKCLFENYMKHSNKCGKWEEYFEVIENIE